MYARLEAGFTRLGVQSELVEAYPSREYPRQTTPGRLGRLVQFLGRKRWVAPRSSVVRVGWKLLQGLSLIGLLAQSLWKFDVFIFAGGVSFLHGLDLPLLRLFGKRVIVIFHGSDCRPPYINGAYVGADTALDVRKCLRLTRRIRRWVVWVNAHTDVIVNHPYATHFNTTPVVNWLSVGHPYEVSATPPSNRVGTSCVIVHAPTRPIPKGTPEIEAAIERLRARGHNVALIKVIGRPPCEVLAAISECDFVVDELYSDTPMAAFATEAAAMGKPAVVGMHDVNGLQRTLPGKLLPPAHVCHPRDLEEAIEKLVVDVDYRRELGAQAMEYVRTYLAPERVAARFLQLATGPFPTDWTFDPANLRYLHGWGLAESRLREVLTAVIECGGLEVLGLSDKPELQQAFADLIGARTDISSPASATAVKL
jgi:hypothetical protein